MTIIMPTPAVPVCDFCSQTPVTWQYPSEPAIVQDRNVAFESADDLWAACDTCHDLIEADKRLALFDRAVGSFGNRYGSADGVDVNALLASLHSEFWAGRNGRPGVRVKAL